MCVSVSVYAWGRRSWEKSEDREKKEKTKIYSHRETDRQTDKHKSFIVMRYNTEQYSKSDSIK